MKKWFYLQISGGNRIIAKVEKIPALKYIVETVLDSVWKNMAKVNLAYGRRVKKEQEEKNSDFLYKLTAVLIAKNEGDYIKEWLEYHQLVGIDHVVIYDNESNDDLKKQIDEYIKEGFVDYQYVSGRGMQIASYNDAVVRYKNVSKYLAFIDADEFLVPLSSQDIYDTVDELMCSNPNAGGVVVNWRMFGPSGHVKKPEGLVIENYLYRTKENTPQNNCIKTIANPRLIKEVVHAHYSKYITGIYSIDDSGRPVFGSQNVNHKPSKLRINHYFTKSKEEWDKRRKLGKADTKDVKDLRTDAEFYMYDNKDVYDDYMLKFVEKIRQ